MSIIPHLKDQHYARFRLNIFLSGQISIILFLKTDKGPSGDGLRTEHRMKNLL